jgi:hypothetical protein
LKVGVDTAEAKCLFGRVYRLPELVVCKDAIIGVVMAYGDSVRRCPCLETLFPFNSFVGSGSLLTVDESRT